VPETVCLILVVEDEPLLRQLLTTALEGRGYRLMTASDGQEGFEKLQTGSYNLLLTDFHMPRMTGIALIQALREKGLLIPTILMSSNTLEELALTALDLDGIQFLRKPFGMSELYASVHRALKSTSR
jgi:DNA-binding response OmpR family regulator